MDPGPAFDFRGDWLYADDRDIVHLVETAEPKAPTSVASINHLALRIADFEAAKPELKDCGIRIESETTPANELRQLNVTDPNGVRIELNALGTSRAQVRYP